MPRLAQVKNARSAPFGRTGRPTQQALKSAQTRLQLIEATIRCLIEYGYANTTTPRVAVEAGLSRGAMLHHFENGPALIRAAITHLHEKRLKAFKRAVSRADAEDVGGLVRGYWAQVSTPTFIAFHELAIAARTDPELARILVPAQQDFNEQWYGLAVELFPAWQADRKHFDLALALAQNLLEGMAINRLIYGIDDDHVAMLLDNLEAQIRALRPAPSEEAAKPAKPKRKTR